VEDMSLHDGMDGWVGAVPQNSLKQRDQFWRIATSWATFGSQ